MASLGHLSLLWNWIVTAPAFPALRVLAALLSLVVLYRALGEPGSGWSGAPREIARRLGWALLGAAVFFVLTARWVPEERAPTTGRGFEAFVSGSVAFRMGYTPVADQAKKTLEERDGAKAAKPKVTQDAADRLKTAAELIPQSAYIQRYAGIALADRRRYSEALTLLDRSCNILSQRAPERAAEERELWHRVYGPDFRTEAELRDDAARLQTYRLGWIGAVAELAAYRHSLPNSIPEALKTRVETEASSWLGTMTAGMFVIAFGVPQLGLICLIVGFVLIRTGVLRPAPEQDQPVSPVLWEAFILMMAVQMAPGFIAFGGRGLSAERQPTTVAMYLIGLDLLQVVSVLYLWWRLRGRGFTLAEVGLTHRHLASDVLVGVMAAAVITPLAFLVNLVTMQLSQRYFPSVAPPFHPLGLYTATSTSPEIRFAWFFAAVIGAPLIEETFFRGALFGALRRRFGFWPGVLLSSGVFAILHPQLPLGFIPIFTIGAGFAMLAHWRKSLVPGMVAHALNNWIAFSGLVLLFPQK